MHACVHAHTFSRFPISSRLGLGRREGRGEGKALPLLAREVVGQCSWVPHELFITREMRRGTCAAIVAGLLPAAMGFQAAVGSLAPSAAGARPCPRFHGLLGSAENRIRVAPGGARCAWRMALSHGCACALQAGCPCRCVLPGRCRHPGTLVSQPAGCVRSPPR